MRVRWSSACHVVANILKCSKHFSKVSQLATTELLSAHVWHWVSRMSWTVRNLCVSDGTTRYKVRLFKMWTSRITDHKRRMSFYTISVSKHENETETVTCKTQTNTPKCLDSTGYPPGDVPPGDYPQRKFPYEFSTILKAKIWRKKTALIRTPDLIRPTRRVLTLTTHRGLPPGDFLRGNNMRGKCPGGRLRLRTVSMSRLSPRFPVTVSTWVGWERVMYWSNWRAGTCCVTERQRTSTRRVTRRSTDHRSTACRERS